VSPFKSNTTCFPKKSPNARIQIDTPDLFGNSNVSSLKTNIIPTKIFPNTKKFEVCSHNMVVEGSLKKIIEKMSIEIRSCTTLLHKYVLSQDNKKSYEFLKMKIILQVLRKEMITEFAGIRKIQSKIQSKKYSTSKSITKDK